MVKPVSRYIIERYDSSYAMNKPIVKRINEFIRNCGIGRCIIFVRSKLPMLDVVSRVLKEALIPFFAYHKDMTREDLTYNYNQWSVQPGAVLVATSAVSTGVNPRHVKLVVHYGMPFDMCTWYQAIGRLARSSGEIGTSVTMVTGSEIRASTLTDAEKIVAKLIDSEVCIRQEFSGFMGDQPMPCAAYPNCMQCSRCANGMPARQAVQRHVHAEVVSRHAYQMQKMADRTLFVTVQKEMLQSNCNISKGGCIFCRVFLQQSCSSKAGKQCHFFYRRCLRCFGKHALIDCGFKKSQHASPSCGICGLQYVANGVELHLQQSTCNSDARSVA